MEIEITSNVKKKIEITSNLLQFYIKKSLIFRVKTMLLA